MGTPGPHITKGYEPRGVPRTLVIRASLSDLGTKGLCYTRDERRHAKTNYLCNGKNMFMQWYLQVMNEQHSSSQKTCRFLTFYHNHCKSPACPGSFPGSCSGGAWEQVYSNITYGKKGAFLVWIEVTFLCGKGGVCQCICCRKQ